MVWWQQDKAHETEQSNEVCFLGAFLLEIHDDTFGVAFLLGPLKQSYKGLSRFADGGIGYVDIELTLGESALPLCNVNIDSHDSDLGRDLDRLLIRQLAQISAGQLAVNVDGVCVVVVVVI